MSVVRKAVVGVSIDGVEYPPKESHIALWIFRNLMKSQYDAGGLSALAEPGFKTIDADFEVPPSLWTNLAAAEVASYVGLCLETGSLPPDAYIEVVPSLFFILWNVLNHEPRVKVGPGAALMSAARTMVEAIPFDVNVLVDKFMDRMPETRLTKRLRALAHVCVSSATALTSVQVSALFLYAAGVKFVLPSTYDPGMLQAVDQFWNIGFAARSVITIMLSQGYGSKLFQACFD